MRKGCRIGEGAYFAVIVVVWNCGTDGSLAARSCHNERPLAEEGVLVEAYARCGYKESRSRELHDSWT